MFGIGPQEMVLIGLLFLVIFGPGGLPGMARDIGRFVSQARGSLDEFKAELMSGEDQLGSGTPESEPGRERAVSGSRKRTG